MHRLIKHRVRCVALIGSTQMESKSVIYMAHGEVVSRELPELPELPASSVGTRPRRGPKSSRPWGIDRHGASSRRTQTRSTDGEVRTTRPDARRRPDAASRAHTHSSHTHPSRHEHTRLATALCGGLDGRAPVHPMSPRLWRHLNVGAQSLSGPLPAVSIEGSVAAPARRSRALECVWSAQITVISQAHRTARRKLWLTLDAK